MTSSIQEGKGKIVYSVNTPRLIIMGLAILLIWFSIMALWYLKADEITKNPCKICAEKLGEDFQCYSLTHEYEPINFYANDSVNETFTQ